MQKISDLLQLKLGHCKPFLVFVIVIAFFVGCGHFQRPHFTDETEYVPQSEFATPEELYNSEAILKTPTQDKRHDASFQLRWPLTYVSINRGFSNYGRREHFGLDLRGRLGTPVLAAHSGVVIYAGSRFRGFGRMIIIEYDDTWATLYAHLSKFKVKMGDSVKAGQIIGLMGRTGQASGVHLHFELMNSKIPIDPVPLLPQSTPSQSVIKSK